MFKVGDKVMVNPYWDKSLGSYGISIWKEYCGEIFAVRIVGENALRVDENPYVWPFYMLMPMSTKSIRFFLAERRHNGISSR